jgi:hypothetical protein
MGFSLAQSLFVGPYNLVVEGTHDLWYLLEMNGVMRALGLATLRKEITVTSSGGAPKVPYMSALLSGHKLKVAVLLDADAEGNKAKDELVKKWIVSDKLVTTIEEVTGLDGSTIEDLFDRSFYVEAVNQAFADKLKAPITISNVPADEPCLVSIVRLVKAQGVTFNKGTVAKQIVRSLPKTKSLGKSTQNFGKLFDLLNARTEPWFSNLDGRAAVLLDDQRDAPVQVAP